MSPSILVVGATGNTGKAVTRALPHLLKESKSLSSHRILALTRDTKSAAAQELATVTGVEVIQYDWTEITAEWLRKHEVVRAFIAPHNATNQFAEESAFHIAALNAGLDYVVRISTTSAAVSSDCGSFIGRAHWAVETLLASPQFAALKFTSVRPNVFADNWLQPVVQYVKQYKQTGEQQPLKLLMAKDAPVAPVDPNEVGTFAAHLLAVEDISPHNGARYVINGPENISGEQMVEMIEKHTGTKPKDVVYQDLSFLEYLLASDLGAGQSRTLIESIKYGLMLTWEGKCSAATTSREVLDIAPPRQTPTDIVDRLL